MRHYRHLRHKTKNDNDANDANDAWKTNLFTLDNYDSTRNIQRHKDAAHLPGVRLQKPIHTVC